VRLITWNVNSITARMPRVLELLEAEQPDVVCLQETRATTEGFPHLELQAAGYHAVVHGTSGRNGVAVLARDELDLVPAATGLPGEPEPDEARWVEADVAGLRVASVYVPNGQAVGTEAFAAKLAFLERAAERAGKLAAAGPAVIAGDVNVCATDADAWDVTALHGGTHATPEERARLAAVCEAGFTDAYRALRPDETTEAFTWFDYRGGAYHRREGLRIDQVLVTADVAERLADARVARAYRKGSKPSDHAPLAIELTGGGC
jgi:exodeoxyribonuclease-3